MIARTGTGARSVPGVALGVWVAGLLLALSACANGASAPGASYGSEPGKVTTIHISGLLTLKGAEPGVWWAVTDDQGQIWKITSPTSDQQAILRKAQNRRIRVEGRQLDHYLRFEQIEPSRITAAPNP